MDGLESELGLRLADLRAAEANLSDRADTNTALAEELRGASARLRVASAARSALLSFCQQQRAVVEAQAVEQVSRAEAAAGMRGEEGLAKGLELARLAEEAGEVRVAASSLEVDRLGKALFSSRSDIARGKEREQALRRELSRAAETIASLSSGASASSKTNASVSAAAAGVGETAARALPPSGGAAAAAVPRGAASGVRAGVAAAEVAAALAAAVAASVEATASGSIGLEPGKSYGRLGASAGLSGVGVAPSSSPPPPPPPQAPPYQPASMPPAAAAAASAAARREAASVKGRVGERSVSRVVDSSALAATAAVGAAAIREADVSENVGKANRATSRKSPRPAHDVE